MTLPQAGSGISHDPTPPRGDARRPFRVFLACSLELSDERDGFDAVIRAMEQDPAVSRSVRPEPVRWETSAFGADPTGANRAIALSVDFPALDAVVVVFWRRVGQWTLDEYERALALSVHHGGRPKLLVYVREPPAGEQSPPDVVAFRERAFAEGVVVSPYRSSQEFLERLPRDLWTAHAPPSPVPDVSRTRRHFFTWGAANLCLGVMATIISSSMSFPTDGVSRAPVLAILFAPIVLMLTTLATVVAYRRVLLTFKSIWRSPAYTDEKVWTAFTDLVPALVMPRRTTSRQDRGSAILLARVALTLALAVVSGPIGAANAVFNEILLWEYVVGWQVVHGESGPVLDSAGFVESSYVDRDRRLWPLSLQNPEVRDFRQSHPEEQIHVHAHGRFCLGTDVRSLAVDRRFRCNLGPEVKLPAYAWMFVVAVVAAAATAMMVPLWITMFRRELTLLPWEV